MPRAKKKKKGAALEAKAKLRDKEVAEYWSNLITRALAERKDYDQCAEAVMQFLGPDHSKLYEDEAVAAKFMSFKGSAGISIPKIAQMRNTLGPRLYQTKPHRTITPMTDDKVMLGLARALEVYSNYTVKETGFKKQFRKSIDDSMIRGRGILMQGVEPVRGLVTSRFLSSLDFVFDPDFFEIEDAKWIAVRTTEPLWETKRRIPEKWRLKGLGEQDYQTQFGKPKTTDQKGSFSSEQISYWTVYSKMGAGFRGMEKSTRRDDSNDFVRLEIVLDHEVPLAEGPWDIPFYLDKDWPVEPLDLIDPLDKGWPDSLGGQVLASQEAIDLLSSLRIASCKNRDRVVIFGDKQVLDKASTMQLKSGTEADFIGIDLPQGKTLQDVMMVANFGQGSQESLMEREYHTQQMEITTGVTDVIHGGQEAGAKERSATASRLRSDAANTRVADLRDRTETCHTNAARKEAIITRLMLDADEVAKAVPVTALGPLFYVRVEVPGGAPVPIRDTRPEEERKAKPEPDILTMEQIAPEASTFFEDPMQATEAALGVFESILMSEDPRVIELGALISPNEIDPMTGLPPSISVDVVTVQTIWEATAGIDAETLMDEFSYELATGSGHQLNKEAMQENADYLVQTVMPAAMGLYQTTGNPDALNKILTVRFDAFDVPPGQRVFFDPILPPQPQPGEEGDKGPPKGGE